MRQSLNSPDQISGNTPIGDANTFGASIGGPILIPKVYNGKNKTFFYFRSDAPVPQLPGPDQREYSHRRRQHVWRFDRRSDPDSEGVQRQEQDVLLLRLRRNPAEPERAGLDQYASSGLADRRLLRGGGDHRKPADWRAVSE